MKQWINLIILSCFLCCHIPCWSQSTLIIEPDAGETPVISLIKKAKHSIDVAIYSITRSSLLDALATAQQKGVRVRVLLESTPYQHTDENQTAFSFFKAHHIAYHFPPRTYHFLHQKTMILDHQTAMIMTFNFTDSTFQSERNVAVTVTTPALVKEIEKVFRNDWENQSVSVHENDLVWSPINSREKITAFIHHATTSIEIIAPTLQDYQIIGALANAAKKGVFVKIIVSDLSEKKYHYLKKSGAFIYLVKNPFIHAKVILIDHRDMLLGSINFTTESLDHNRELSIILHDKKIAKEISALLKCGAY